MKRLNNHGAALLGLVAGLMTVLFFFALGFGVWAFTSRSDYKNNADKKIEAAVEVAKQKVNSDKDTEFLEKEKSPYKSYTGSEAQGSISFQYPKTWSGLVSETNTTGAGSPIDGFFYPNQLPGINIATVSYALRIQVIAQSYDTVLTNYTGQAANVAARINPYRLPKVPSVLGVKIDGTVAAQKEGSMVILPLRDKTLQLWTESSQFLGDFNNTILPSTVFVP